MKIRLSLLLVAALALMLVGAVFAQEEAPSGELEIFSWWAGDEGPALEALIDLYTQQYPDVEVINATVTGGSGVNARAVLKTRMLGGDPPDSFQVHAGAELTGTWVVADRMEDLTWLYEEEGWFDAFPQDLIDLLTYEGGIYSVPVNIHRSNVMWYVPANLEEWGVEVPETLDDFFAACETLQGAGVLPLAVGEAWTVNHLWESVALGVLGVDNWNALWNGELSPTSDEMIAVWDTFGRVLDCSNIDDDAAGLSWQQAVDKVIAGEAAFNIMGDWAAGYMTTTLGLEPGVDYGYAAAPGTGGVFMWLSDSFGLPKDAPNRDATVAWLRLLGSVEGQNAFNPLKGSIPARVDAVDAAPDLYNAYLQSAAADWASDRLAGSLVHGVAANERFMGDFNQVMQIYLTSRDSNAAAAAMEAICIQAGACGF
ncbi:MAG: carbohydrate ABC transporter substrate-binding protein [Chloroflexi bacterium]|nr:MAG: carbohydrate ABC transporter substrate-binding protein [Chloroflexota bacterium]